MEPLRLYKTKDFTTSSRLSKPWERSFHYTLDDGVATITAYCFFLHEPSEHRNRQSNSCWHIRRMYGFFLRLTCVWCWLFGGTTIQISHLMNECERSDTFFGIQKRKWWDPERLIMPSTCMVFLSMSWRL